MPTRPRFLLPSTSECPTEDQQYSIPNQQSRIREYAEKNGFIVIQTYKDPGRSGVTIKHRDGLKSLPTNDGASNFDIHLPNWLASHNKGSFDRLVPRRRIDSAVVLIQAALTIIANDSGTLQ